MREGAQKRQGTERRRDQNKRKQSLETGKTTSNRKGREKKSWEKRRELEAFSSC